MPQYHANKMKVLSANCRGLGTKAKRDDVITYLRDTNANIVCLQDTHLKQSMESHVRKIWNGEVYCHSISSNARGVAILLRNNFEYTISHTEKDDNGNLMIMDLNIEDLKIRLVNIYGPNADDTDFYLYVRSKIYSSQQDHIVICGDLNLTLNPELDF